MTLNGNQWISKISKTLINNIF